MLRTVVDASKRLLVSAPVGRFDDRIALVTGAGGGIGRATVERLTSEGARVACVDVDEDAARASGGALAHAVRRRRPGIVRARPSPRPSSSSVGSTSSRTSRAWDRSRRTRELALDDWNRTLAVNLTGTFLMSQAALDPLLETGGAIVNMASVSGLRALPYNAAYTASKGGVVMLTKAMAVEFGRAGLRVNCVCPSSVDTDFLRGFEYPADADTVAVRVARFDHPAGRDARRDRGRRRVPRVGRSGDGHRRRVDRRWRCNGMTDSVEIRAGLTHPVVDIDGHMIEYFPALSGFLRAGGDRPVEPLDAAPRAGCVRPDGRLALALPGGASRAARAAPAVVGLAGAQHARSSRPRCSRNLLHERLPELGIDFSVVYPSIGLIYLHLEDERERRAACRALNRYNADAFADLGDRLTPVAAIPMVTPEEAVDELEHAVGELGFKAVVMNGFVQRPADAFADTHPDLARWGMWVDTYGVDSAYDYDPVWQKCRELGVPASFHSGSMGWGSRMSYSNYMHNHIGQLNEGNHAVCKSLFLGGVTRRFPDVSFAFMEGGVAWAAMLFVDLLGHWEKRNVDALATLDPSGIDVALLGELREQYGGKVARARGGGRDRRAIEHGDARAGGPVDARRVGRVPDHARRRHPRPVRAALLLRLRGRRSHDVDRLQHKGEPLRRTAQRDVRLRHRALGRARHGRGVGGGVGDGGARAHHRSRLPRLRVHQSAPPLHQRQPEFLRRHDRRIRRHHRTGVNKASA